MIDLRLRERINSTARIELIDVTGRTVYIGNAPATNGVLQKQLFVPSALASGIYMVKVLVNNEAYLSRLVYQK